MDSQTLLEDILRGQMNVVASQARTEGTVEGIKLAIDGINSILAGVADVRADIAVLKERDRHPDPLISIMQGQLNKLIESDQRRWVEGLIRLGLAGVGGGSVVAALQHFLRG